MTTTEDGVDSSVISGESSIYPKRSADRPALDHILLLPVTDLTEFKTPPKSYNPLFAHHFFPDEILPVGVLELRVYFTPDTFFYYFDFDVDPNSPGADVENLRPVLAAAFGRVEPAGFLEKSQFEAQLKSRDFEPPGREIRRFNIEGLQYELRRARFGVENPAEEPEEEITHAATYGALHRRLEFLLHFFIEAFSEIEQDVRWQILLLYQILPGGDRFLVVVSTAYRFWSLPRGRVRVSQFLVFPSHQGKGLGRQVLASWYKQALSDNEVREITVEDAAENFEYLHDSVSLRIALERDVFPPSVFFSSPQPAEDLIPSLRDTLMAEMKESLWQVDRTLAILEIARQLPDPIPAILLAPPPVKDDADEPPPAKRAHLVDPEALSEDIINALKLVRLQVKADIFRRNDEDLQHPEYKADLEDMWQARLHGHARTIRSLRRAIHEKRGMKAEEMKAAEFTKRAVKADAENVQEA